MGFYSAVDRIREIQEHLRADAAAAEREYQRAMLVPKQNGPRPNRARTDAIEKALNRMETFERKLHRLDKMVAQAETMDTEAHRALDAFEGRKESAVSGTDGTVNEALVRRWVRELNSPTNPMHPQFDPQQEPEFDHRWDEIRRNVWATADSYNSLTLEQQVNATRQVWNEQSLHEDMPSKFSGATPLEQGRMLDTYLGPDKGKEQESTLKGMDPDLYAALQENSFTAKGESENE